MSLEQADGTAWMAYYALSMLVIALVLVEENDVYWDMVIKFLEQFVLVARALERQGLYDTEDAFFYDRLVFPSGESTQVKVKTISGLLPLLPAVPLRRGSSEPPSDSGSVSLGFATPGRRPVEHSGPAGSAGTATSRRCFSR